MNLWQAVLLGAVQGLTEFLPISSSGHLVIFQKLLGFEEAPVLFNIVVHAGTLVAVMLALRSQIANLSKDLIKLIIIGSLPAIVAGLLIKPYIEFIFSNILLVAIGLFISGIFLSRSKYAKPEKSATARQAVVIGLSQALAILPGVSRSGSTISTALQTGMAAKQAFSFSFLLAIPAISGALILQLISEPVSSSDIIPLITGFLVACIVGYIALKLVEKLVISKKYYFFSYYCYSLSFLLIFQMLLGK